MEFATWVAVGANLVAVTVGVITVLSRARRWLTANVTEKLDGLAEDLRNLATKHGTLSDRFETHVRDHDAHRRTWRF
jgi:hypothetical protein